jgi:hypothetical protein
MVLRTSRELEATMTPAQQEFWAVVDSLEETSHPDHRPWPLCRIDGKEGGR